MRKCLFLIVLLVACSQEGGQNGNQHEEQTETIIEWVDFVKINEQQYEALYTVAIAEEKFIGDEKGKIEFKVNGNITDPNYRIENGDAAFLEKGTIVYHVKNRPDLIAVADKAEINGYRIYQRENAQEIWRFDHVDTDCIKKIEIWKESNRPELMNTITDEKAINQLLAILKGSRQRDKDSPYEEDPIMYDIVLYQDESIANYYPLVYQDDEWYWLPWEEEILTEEMEGFIKREE